MNISTRSFFVRKFIQFCYSSAISRLHPRNFQLSLFLKSYFQKATKTPITKILIENSMTDEEDEEYEKSVGTYSISKVISVKVSQKKIH